jgi:tetratricopeptide (TPR) repeat protein
MRIRWFLIAFLFMCFALIGQAQDMLIKNADDYFKKQQYNRAIELYKKAYDKNPKSYYIIKRLALSYQRIRNTGEAERWMDVMFENGRTTSSDYLMFAEILIENGKYEEARKFAADYIAQKPDDKKAQEIIDRIDFIKSTVSDSLSYRVGKVTFNSPGAELGACFYGKGLIFSSTSLSGTKNDLKLAEDELPYLDLYYADELAPGQFSEVVPFAPELKTKYNDGPLAYDPTENLFYVTQYSPKAANMVEGENIFHLQIIVAEENAKGWVFKEKFKYDSPNYSVAHPTISPDGKSMYFVSDMPGGYGGYDIYFCYKNGDEWSEPYNIGPGVNSRGNEFFPFIDSRGDLYFTSDGFPGLGAQDIFVVSPENGVFKHPRNLGYPFNSPKDDVALVLDPKSERGYFSSNRAGGLGYYDIYSMQANFIRVSLKGTVKDNSTKAIIPDANIKISETLSTTLGETRTGSDGSFDLPINKKSSITITVEKEGYEPISKPIDIGYMKSGETLNLEIFLRKK